MEPNRWVAKAKCPVCGQYFWTTQGAGNVYCVCGASGLVSNALVGEALPVTDNPAFVAAVLEDTGRTAAHYEDE